MKMPRTQVTQHSHTTLPTTFTHMKGKQSQNIDMILT